MMESDLIARYFAADLDGVERRDLERRLADDAELRGRFDEAYDERTATLGFLAMAGGNPDLRECFSTRTLESYVGGALDREAHAMVQAHLACPICAAQVEGIRRQALGSESALVANQGEVATSRWRRRSAALVALTAVAAVALLMVRDNGTRMRAAGEDVEITILHPPNLELTEAPASVRETHASTLSVRLHNPSDEPRAFVVAVGEPRRFVEPTGGAMRTVDAKETVTILIPDVHSNLIHLYVVTARQPHRLSDLLDVWPAAVTGERVLSIEGAPRLSTSVLLRVGD